ncbi:ANTAR domain-containing protein [Streptomyces sp. NPDC051684]|uniref:ANTAR domain-containing protein n=1 Tax=Streptomyces sp. NPDC051684 TaxID=3365670 RepID=UPI0037940330
MARERRLAEVFVEVTDSLIDDFDVIDMLQRLTARCVELLDVSAAGVMLADVHGQLQVVAASDERSKTLELFELQYEQGPSVESHRSARALTNVDLTDPLATAEWGRFALLAHSSGYRTTHAVPLRLRDQVVGALSLFQTSTEPLRTDDIALAQALADVATIIVLQQRSLEQVHLEKSQVERALTSRIVIEQAKGVLAERWGTSVDEAFEAFRRYARSQHLRLSEFAATIVDGSFDTRVVPPPKPGPANRGT